MWSSISSYLYSSSPYTLMNINNIHNFILSSMKNMNDEDKKKYVQQIKLNIGMSYYLSLREYVFRKLSDTELLEFFKSQ